MSICNKITNFFVDVIEVVAPKQGKPVAPITDATAIVFMGFAYTYFGLASAFLVGGNYLLGRVTHNALSETDSHKPQNSPAVAAAQPGFSVRGLGGGGDEKHISPSFSVHDLLDKLGSGETRVRSFLEEHIQVTDPDVLSVAVSSSRRLNPSEKELLETLINSMIYQ